MEIQDKNRQGVKQSISCGTAGFRRIPLHETNKMDTRKTIHPTLVLVWSVDHNDDLPPEAA